MEKINTRTRITNEVENCLGLTFQDVLTDVAPLSAWTQVDFKCCKISAACERKFWTVFFWQLVCLWVQIYERLSTNESLEASDFYFKT